MDEKYVPRMTQNFIRAERQIVAREMCNELKYDIWSILLIKSDLKWCFINSVTLLNCLAKNLFLIIFNMIFISLLKSYEITFFSQYLAKFGKCLPTLRWINDVVIKAHIFEMATVEGTVHVTF